MPQSLRRFYGGGDLHFLTFSCYQRKPLLSNTSRCDLFLQTLERVRRRYRIVILGYVVMPEHVHLLVSEPQRATLSTAIQALKLGFLRSLEDAYGGTAVPRSRKIGETWGTPWRPEGCPAPGTASGLRSLRRGARRRRWGRGCGLRPLLNLYPVILSVACRSLANGMQVEGSHDCRFHRRLLRNSGARRVPPAAFSRMPDSSLSDENRRGVLRLRLCFARRSRGCAQDDTALNYFLLAHAIFLQKLAGWNFLHPASYFQLG